MHPSSSWEGCCTSEDRIYHAFLCGDSVRETYTLDLARGAFRLKVTQREDRSWLSRRGQESGWNKATVEEVAVAHDALRSAVRERPGMPVPKMALNERSNVRELRPQAAPVRVGRWLRSAAARSLLAAAFAFIVLALF